MSKSKTKRKKLDFFVVETKVYNRFGDLIAQRCSYIPGDLPPEPDEAWWRANVRRRPL